MPRARIQEQEEGNGKLYAGLGWQNAHRQVEAQTGSQPLPLLISGPKEQGQMCWEASQHWKWGAACLGWLHSAVLARTVILGVVLS